MVRKNDTKTSQDDNHITDLQNALKESIKRPSWCSGTINASPDELNLFYATQEASVAK